MGTELVAMSKKELERLEVVRRVVEGRLTQAKAGEFIGLSERQVRRLCARRAISSLPNPFAA